MNTLYTRPKMEYNLFCDECAHLIDKLCKEDEEWYQAAKRLYEEYRAAWDEYQYDMAL